MGYTCFHKERPTSAKKSGGLAFFIKKPLSTFEPKLSVIKTIWLKSLLSSQNPVTISHAFMSARGLRNCVIDLIADNLGEIPNQMKNLIHGRCFNINDLFPPFTLL